MELSASRRNLMDASNSGRGFKGKSFKRTKSVETGDGAKSEEKPNDKAAEAVDSMP